MGNTFSQSKNLLHRKLNFIFLKFPKNVWMVWTGWEQSIVPMEQHSDCVGASQSVSDWTKLDNYQPVRTPPDTSLTALAKYLPSDIPFDPPPPLSLSIPANTPKLTFCLTFFLCFFLLKNSFPTKILCCKRGKLWRGNEANTNIYCYIFMFYE